MNLTLLIGFVLAGGILYWGLKDSGIAAATAIFNLHGLVIVIGGTLAAACVNCPFRQLGSALQRLISLFTTLRLISPEDIIAEIVRLARKAQAEGGTLALQDESRGFGDGFLHRAILVMIASGETSETRRVLETQIKQQRIGRQEDANVFRTIGILSPMFGLLGTLMGMIRVLETMSEPTKVGPAMALALSSAFIGIGIANFICVPIAGRIRLYAMRETLLSEMILEGILDLSAGKAPYQIEVHLASYSQRRRQELETRETRAGAAETAA